MTFEKNVFTGFLVKGELNAAISYLSGFSDQSELCGRYREVFDEDKRPVYENDAYLNEILDVYRKYYREVFYLNNNTKEAEKRMGERFGAIFGNFVTCSSIEETEEKYVFQAFNERGFSFLVPADFSARMSGRIPRRKSTTLNFRTETRSIPLCCWTDLYQEAGWITFPSA